MEKTIRRERRTRQQIIDLLELFKTSGSSVKEFCIQHGMTPAAFHKWQSRTRHDGVKAAGAGFTKVHIDQGTSCSLFAEVGMIRLYQMVPASYLKELAR